ERMVEISIRLVKSIPPDGHLTIVVDLMEYVVRALRQLGRLEAAGRFRERVADRFMAGRAHAASGAHPRGAERGGEYLGILPALSETWVIARAWDQARPIIDEVTAVLVDPSRPMTSVARARLLSRYAGTLGQADPAAALPRIEAIFTTQQSLYND